jgi:hypothetical protein
MRGALVCWVVLACGCGSASAGPGGDMPGPDAGDAGQGQGDGATGGDDASLSGFVDSGADASAADAGGDSGGSPDSGVDAGSGSSCNDSDGDGVCNADDLCSGHDDALDDDSDDVPDDCDTCPMASDDDGDGNGYADACENVLWTASVQTPLGGEFIGSIPFGSGDFSTALSLQFRAIEINPAYPVPLSCEAYFMPELFEVGDVGEAVFPAWHPGTAGLLQCRAAIAAGAYDTSVNVRLLPGAGVGNVSWLDVTALPDLAGKTPLYFRRTVTRYETVKTGSATTFHFTGKWELVGYTTPP